MTLLFTTTNLTPDTSAIVAWLVQEALAWFLSLPPEAAVMLVGLGWWVIVSVLLILFVLAEWLLTWAMEGLN